ncbi:MAG TPA: hypothetical protein ENI92_10125 [Bacteroidetes bacterium]|nr:hypothetical protein [Bacteroidota bacterium]
MPSRPVRRVQPGGGAGIRHAGRGRGGGCARGGLHPRTGGLLAGELPRPPRLRRLLCPRRGRRGAALHRARNPDAVRRPLRPEGHLDRGLLRPGGVGVGRGGPPNERHRRHFTPVFRGRRCAAYFAQDAVRK